jgi:CRISPR-associated endonuclease Cas3-HD
MNYSALITAIAAAHQQAQAGAAGAVNRHLILRNWLIGAHLVEFEQHGEDRAQYGTRLLQRVSTDLRERNVPGTSADMLERMRLLYLYYPQLADRISAPPVRKLAAAEPTKSGSEISAPPVRKSGSDEARLAGLLHDFGKYAPRFQDRLHDNTIHGINHWVAGARKAAESKAPLLDYAIDGHHTGIPPFGELQQSLQKMGNAAWIRELTGCAESVTDQMRRFSDDGLVLPPVPPAPARDHFANAFRARFLFSCLVDADFIDTEEHFDPAAAAQRVVPLLQSEQAFYRLFAFLSAKPADGPVNPLRRQLLADCLAAAGKPPGLFTLTAPTGSGKTLASLAFALKHITTYNTALPHDDPRRQRRIIVVIPYTSIIEQTARVYRELFEPAFGPTLRLTNCLSGSSFRRLESPGRLMIIGARSPLIAQTCRTK